ncbi:hypothetical protein WJR50_24365 [Catalinimonas sp. 4WD22]|uniref:hypothetical protein n=1 Tax=Catalinimonas locisalis TaxID=3133978 RepID=UPI003101AD1F
MKPLVFLIFLAISSTLIFFAFTQKDAVENEAQIQIVNLSKGDTSGFDALRSSFKKRNPGYDLDFFFQQKSLPSKDAYRLVFIQTGEGEVSIKEKSSEFSVGDIIYLDKGESLESDSKLDALVFDVPDPLPSEVPQFIRPDWDPNITDVPGGCATERNAYRRILLTWKDEVGEYLYHALNAHRVRIMDSFTHYHPIDGGFDEFYLVQMVLPGARLITSTNVDLIEQPHKLEQADAHNLLQSTDLEVGDLVYIPRGIAHRGLGGVLTQVITVPGFIPGSEIGIDHHLRAINESLSLEGEDAIPYNKDASEQAVIK